MHAIDLVHVQLGYLSCCIGVCQRKEVTELNPFVDYDQNAVEFGRLGQAIDKIHRDEFPRFRWNWQR